MTKIKLMVTAIAAFVLINSSAAAQDVTYPYATQEIQPFAVKYMGTDGNYLVFQVVMQSPVKKISSFSVNDVAEGELYSTNFRAPYKKQILKIEKKADEQELDFRFVSGKNVYLKTFYTNKTVVDNVVAVNL